MTSLRKRKDVMILGINHSDGIVGLQRVIFLLYLLFRYKKYTRKQE